MYSAQLHLLYLGCEIERNLDCGNHRKNSKKNFRPLSQIFWSSTVVRTPMATMQEPCSQFTRLSEMGRKNIL